ncbi:MAG: MFS transporter, partial [Candidatus Omnitrophota bacterium]
VGVVSLFGTAYVVLMPVYAKEIFHSDSRALAILMSANGLGALIGALNLARQKPAVAKNRMLRMTALIFFVSVMLFAFAPTLSLAAFLLILAGYGGTSSMSLVNTLIQVNIADEFRGRLMAIFVMMFGGLMPFGNLLAGSLAHFWGAPLVVFLGGLVSLLLYFFFDARLLNQSRMMPDFT